MKQKNMNEKNGFFNCMFGFGYLARSIAWLLAIVLMAGIFGRALWRSNITVPDTEEERRTVRKPMVIDWTGVEADVMKAMTEAREAAHEHASEELGTWIQEVNTRIEERFLPWYFGYWTQKGIGFRAIGYWLAERESVERVIGEQPSMNQQITSYIQDEFEKRVLRPAISQRELEAITQNTMHVYFASSQGRLSDIQARYDIPRAEWEGYLADMAGLATGGKPDTTPVTLKTVYASTGVGGIVATTAMIDNIRKMMQHVGMKHGASHAAATTSKTAAKTAGKTGATIKSKWLGPVFFLVLGWDVADHYRSRKVDEPILRENFDDYLAQMHAILLNDSEAGVMGVIHAVETQLVRSS